MYQKNVALFLIFILHAHAALAVEPHNENKGLTSPSLPEKLGEKEQHNESEKKNLELKEAHNILKENNLVPENNNIPSVNNKKEEEKNNPLVHNGPLNNEPAQQQTQNETDKNVGKIISQKSMLKNLPLAQSSLNSTNNAQKTLPMRDLQANLATEQQKTTEILENAHESVQKDLKTVLDMFRKQNEEIAEMEKTLTNAHTLIKEIDFNKNPQFKYFTKLVQEKKEFIKHVEQEIQRLSQPLSSQEELLPLNQIKTNKIYINSLKISLQKEQKSLAELSKNIGNWLTKIKKASTLPKDHDPLDPSFIHHEISLTAQWDAAFKPILSLYKARRTQINNFIKELGEDQEDIEHIIALEHTITELEQYGSEISDQLKHLIVPSPVVPPQNADKGDIAISQKIEKMWDELSKTYKPHPELFQEEKKNIPVFLEKIIKILEHLHHLEQTLPQPKAPEQNKKGDAAKMKEPLGHIQKLSEDILNFIQEMMGVEQDWANVVSFLQEEEAHNQQQPPQQQQHPQQFSPSQRPHQPYQNPQYPQPFYHGEQHAYSPGPYAPHPGYPQNVPAGGGHIIPPINNPAQQKPIQPFHDPSFGNMIHWERVPFFPKK